MIYPEDSAIPLSNNWRQVHNPSKMTLKTLKMTTEQVIKMSDTFTVLFITLFVFSPKFGIRNAFNFFFGLLI